jgi:hypothetical protein
MYMLSLDRAFILPEWGDSERSYGVCCEHRTNPLITLVLALYLKSHFSTLVFGEAEGREHKTGVGYWPETPVHFMIRDEKSIEVVMLQSSYHLLFTLP